jgi:hypothetical protein
MQILENTRWHEVEGFENIKERHHGLVDRYGISVSQMTMDMFHLS